MSISPVPRYLKEINAQPGVMAEFVGRVSGVEVDEDRDATLHRLRSAHKRVVQDMGFDWAELQRAEQVHGTEIAIVEHHKTGVTESGVDGLITAEANVLLGIYVADCGAVYISDPDRGVLALLHSGKKGTEGNITGRAIKIMIEQFGCRPENLLVALAPCIRPPAYEVDFAAEIRRQVMDAGVMESHYFDSDICTSSDPDLYYSYRVEKGKTGRMLALLGRKPLEADSLK